MRFVEAAKILMFVIIPFLLIGCNNIITKENIKILKSEKHPFLIDHSRIIVIEINGKQIDKAKGYVDTGIGCNSHLFEEKNKFILIDCNGTIFEINKRGGKVKNKGWGWMSELPKKYVGTFERQRGKDEYLLVQKLYPSLEDVYKIKDPND